MTSLPASYNLHLPSSSVCTTDSRLITPQPTLVKPSTLIPYLVYFHNPFSSRLVSVGPTSMSLYMSWDSFMARYSTTKPTSFPCMNSWGIRLQLTFIVVELVLWTEVSVGGLLGPVVHEREKARKVGKDLCHMFGVIKDRLKEISTSWEESLSYIELTVVFSPL